MGRSGSRRYGSVLTAMSLGGVFHASVLMHLAGRVRTEHKAKRNLEALLDKTGW